MAFMTVSLSTPPAFRDRYGKRHGPWIVSSSSRLLGGGLAHQREIAPAGGEDTAQHNSWPQQGIGEAIHHVEQSEDQADRPAGEVSQRDGAPRDGIARGTRDPVARRAITLGNFTGWAISLILALLDVVDGFANPLLWPTVVLCCVFTAGWGYFALVRKPAAQ